MSGGNAIEVLKDRCDATSFTITRMLAQQPFFAMLLLQLAKVYDVPDDSPVTAAATDGRRIYINRKWFTEQTPDARLAVMAHEILHVVYGHPSRGRPYHLSGIGPDGELYQRKVANVAMDILINAIVRDSECGTLPNDAWLPETPLALLAAKDHPNGKFGADDVWEEVYPKLKAAAESSRKSGGKRGGQGGQDGGGGGTGTGDAEGDSESGGPFDGVMEDIDCAGVVEGSGSDSPLSPDEIKAAVAAAHAQAKQAGMGNAVFDRLFATIVDPQVDWREELRANVVATCGSDEYTWARGNRRRLAMAPHVYMPGRTGYAAGCIVGYVDSSGSISSKEWHAYGTEVAGIYDELQPETMWIGDCAHECAEPLLVEDASDITGYKNRKGGGTDMGAIFRKLDECDIVPDTCVILTDGETPWGNEPSYPVIWVITQKHIVAPFGKTIHINVQD